jgi:hypothetical protein
MFKALSLFDAIVSAFGWICYDFNKGEYRTVNLYLQLL